MAKKQKDTEAKPGRKSVWPTGTTPNKTDAKKLAKQFKDGEGRKSKNALAAFCVEHDISTEGLVMLSEPCLGKAIESDAAAALRRAALRAANGGAKVKRKAAAPKDEPKAKSKSKSKKKKSKDKNKGKE